MQRRRNRTAARPQRIGSGLNARGMSNAERTVTVTGSCLQTFSITVGTAVQSLVLNDSIGPNLLTMSDSYGLYRFTEVELILPPTIGVGAAAAWPTIYMVGFTPEALLASPSGVTATAQMPFLAWQGISRLGAGTVVFSGQSNSSFKVGRSALFHTGAKWFRTQGSGTEPDWETQGTFICAVGDVAVTSATTVTVLIKYTCEFTDMLPTSVTRERMREQLSNEVADSLVSRLATPGFSRAKVPPGPLLPGTSQPGGNSAG